MALNRKASGFLLNGSSSTQSHSAFLSRGNATSLDHEREEFEKGQLNALTKCLSLEEAASKEKHVRTLIIGTFKVGGPQIFWQNVKDHIPLHSNDIVTWKFLVVLHRLIQDGHATVPTGSRSYCGFIDGIVNSHKQSKSNYGKLSYSYGGLMISKLLFHAKYPNIPGSLTIKSQSIIKNDAANNFELAVEFLDLLERIIKVKRIILNTFDPGKAHSSTSSGQCRLSALVPCINDSARIFDLLSKIIKVLHSKLPWDTLVGHRKRFQTEYLALEDLYEKLDHFHYLKSAVTIPKLSGNLEEYMSSLHRMEDDPQPPDASGRFGDAFADMTSSTTSESDGTITQDLLTIDHDPLNASLAYYQQEYSDLTVKYQNLGTILQGERTQKAALEQDFDVKERRLNAEIDALRQQNYEMVLKQRESLEAAALATSAAAATTASAENDEKFEKLKSAYQKLRNEHVSLLRQKADIEKSAKSNATEIYGEIIDALREVTNKPVTSKAELMSLLKYLVTDLLQSRKQLKEQTLLMNQLENEKRLLDLDCSEKNVQLKQEFAQKVQLLETEAQNVEKVWRHKLLTHSSLISKRLGACNFVPRNDSIYGDQNPSQMLLQHNANTSCDKLSRIHDLVFYVMFAVMQLMPYVGESVEELTAPAIKLCELLMTENEAQLESAWLEFTKQVDLKIKTAQGMTDFDPSNEIDREIFDMQQSINDAAKAMEKLMLEAKANESKPNLDVDLKIIDSCSQLLVAVQEMIKTARNLQREISHDESTSRKTSTVTKDHYKKNQKWSEGLISAAKDIGGGAKLLVDSANQVVHGDGKFEELIAASQEIAGSTAQMVIASKVKAQPDSTNLGELKTTSKSVAESTAQVIATCRTLSNDGNQDSNLDFSTLSVHQTKRLEMEIQIKVLSLETQLEKQRQQLFKLRKRQYAASTTTIEEKTTEETS